MASIMLDPATPMTCGPVCIQGGPISTVRTPSSSCPASWIAVAVSRAQRQPPASRGQTPDLSSRSCTVAVLAQLLLHLTARELDEAGEDAMPDRVIRPPRAGPPPPPRASGR